VFDSSLSHGIHPETYSVWNKKNQKAKEWHYYITYL